MKRRQVISMNNNYLHNSSLQYQNTRPRPLLTMLLLWTRREPPVTCHQILCPWGTWCLPVSRQTGSHSKEGDSKQWWSWHWREVENTIWKLSYHG